MSIRIPTAAFTAAFILLGCSTPAPEQIGQIPAPEISIDLPLEAPPPKPDEPLARVCKLGASCMDLDPRPFEACLVGTKRCVDKAVPMLAQTPEAPSDSGTVETRIERGD